jgi:hypothetical protein
MQLWAAYVQDAAEHAGKSWTHNDAFDRNKSIAIFRAYMSRYATQNRLGHAPTNEDIARIHNGGPNGYKNSNTVAYWNKVRQHL